MPSPTDPGNPLAAGAVMSALPMDHMIAGPLLACIQAEIRAGKMYADWVQNVGMDENKKAIMIDFEYTEDVLNAQGSVESTNTRKFKIPLLAILQHPSIGVEKATVDFEMTVDTSEANSSSTSGEGSFEAKAGWGPFSVKISGKVSHKSEQTRKTDTRSKYSFHVEVVHRGPTECMQRIMDHITSASIRPVLHGGSSTNGSSTNGSDASGPDSSTP